MEAPAAGQQQRSLSPITRAQLLLDQETELFFTSVGVLQRDAALAIPVPLVAVEAGEDAPRPQVQPPSAFWTPEQRAHNQRANRELSRLYARNLATLQGEMHALLTQDLPAALPSGTREEQDAQLVRLAEDLHHVRLQLEEACAHGQRTSQRLEDRLDAELNALMH